MRKFVLAGVALFFTDLIAPENVSSGTHSRFTCETCHFEGGVDGQGGSIIQFGDGVLGHGARAFCRAAVSIWARPSSEGSHNHRWLGSTTKSPIEKYDAAFNNAAGCATQPSRFMRC